MQIVDVGRGEPLVLIPSLQGRWEYMKRPVEALARSFRVITFSLADEPSAGFPYDPAHPLESFAQQISAALEKTGLDRAALCGISFGGIVALRFAARHPDRTTALVLASTPGPGWTLRGDHAAYTRYPRLSAPVFFAGVPKRTRDELRRALPRRRDRAALAWETVCTFLRAPMSPSRMAARVKTIDSRAAASDASKIRVPTVVIVGEASLDRVVPAETTAAYARLIPGARLVVLKRSGHQGCITLPETFAAEIRDFLAGAHHAAA